METAVNSRAVIITTISNIGKNEKKEEKSIPKVSPSYIFSTLFNKKPREPPMDKIDNTALAQAKRDTARNLLKII